MARGRCPPARPAQVALISRTQLVRELRNARRSMPLSGSNASLRPELLVLGTRGVPAAKGGFETFAEKLALHMRDRGWNVTVYCQRDISNGSPPDGTIDVDHWKGIRRVLISVAGGGPL